MMIFWKPQIVYGGGDEGGGGGGGGSDKTYDSLSDAARDGQHGNAVNIKGKGRQKVEFADKSYNKRMATVSANAGGGGGSVSQAARNLAKTVSTAGGRGPDGRYEPIPGPGTIAQRIKGSFDGTDSFHRPASNFKTINNSQRDALEAAGYSVTKQGTVKSRDGSATVAGSRWSRSNVVNQIMAENADDRASVRSGGGGGKPAPVVPKKIVRPKLRPADLPKPTTAPLDYDSLYGGPMGTSFGSFGNPVDMSRDVPLPDQRRPSYAGDPYAGDRVPSLPPQLGGRGAEVSGGGGVSDDDVYRRAPSASEYLQEQRLLDSFPDGGQDSFPDDESYETAAFGDTGFGKFLNDYVLGDKTQLETTSSPVVPSAPYAPEMPVPPMPVQKRPEGVLPFMEDVGRVATEAEKANPNIDLRPGNPDRLMYGLAGKLGAENTAKLMAVAAQDMARLNEAMPLGSEITGYGEGSIDPRLADAANIQRNVPTMVGDPNVVAQLAQKAEDSIAAIIEDTTAGLNDRTKKALSTKIMEDGFKGAIFDGKFNTDAFMAQSAQVLGGVAPMVAAGTLNPYLGMAVAGAATAGDVSGLVEQKIRARANAGDFGAINPRQLEAVIQQAKMQTTLPSAALGAAGMGIFGKTKIGGMVGEIVAETVAEPTVAQLSSTINTDPLLRVDPKTGKMPGEGNLYDIADADTALLSLVGSAPLAAFTPTQMTPQPATVEDVGTAPVTPSVAESLGKAFGKSSIPRAAGLTRSVLGGPPTAAAAGDVLGKTPVKPASGGIATLPQDNVLNIPGVRSVVPPQPAPPLKDAPADRGPIPGEQPAVQSFVPGDKSALQAASVIKTGEKKAAPNIIDTVAAVELDAALGFPPTTKEVAGKTQEELGTEVDKFGNIVNRVKVPTETDFKNMAAEMVAPTTAKDAAPTQIDKNGASRPENVSSAIDLLKTEGKNSASFLQRKLGINYSEAKAINNQLEAEGYISAPNNVGKRTILTTEPTTAAEELISETAPTVNLADVAANKGTALQGAAAVVDNTLGTTDNMRHDEMIGSSGGLTGSQIYGDVVRALQGKDTVTRVEIMEMTPTMSDGVAGKVLDQLKDMGEVIGGKDANGVFRVNQNAVANEIGVPYENPNKIIMRTPKSAGAAAGSSGVTDAILRKNPEYLPFGYDFNLRGDLETTLQDIAFKQGEANRAAGNPELGATDADAGVVPKTKEDLSRFLIEDLGKFRPYGSTVPTAMDTPQRQLKRQQDNIERARAQRAKTQAEAEAVANMEAFDTSLPVDPAGIGSLRNFPSNIPLVDSPAAQADRRRAIANRLKGEAEAEAMAPLNRAQAALDAVVDPVPAATITNAADNEIAKLEAQLAAINAVQTAGDTTVPRFQGPPTPEFTTPETQAQLSALTTPVETPAMDPLVQPDITPPTLAEFIEAQRAEARDGVPVDPLAAPVNPVSPSVEEAMAKVAKAPTVRAPKDAASLVLTDPVTQSGIASAIPGRIPKDKLPTRFQSDLPVVDPFSRENQLARQAANRARFAEQENELAAAQGLTPASIAQASREQDAAAENRIEKERQAANAAALKGLATLRSPLRVTGIPDDDTVYEDVEEQTLPDELLTEPFNNTPPEDTGGEGTGTSGESAPKYVPVDMNNANNDDLGCPSGYARVFDPSTGQPICGRIDEPSVAGSAAPAEEAEEDDVVIDIPVTERPKISPYYVPEIIESNYTPYVPGRRASTQ